MQTVLVTGSEGVIGRKVIARLASRNDITVIAIDRAASSTGHNHDLSHYDPHWVSLLDGVDCIIHLAAESSPGSSWDDLVPANIDATLNLYFAAAAHGVSKVIFASSVWVLNGRRFVPGLMPTHTVGDPGSSAYGASKLFGERVAKAFFSSHGISTLVLRIGAFNEKAPTRWMSDWDQSAWLGEQDFMIALDAALAWQGQDYQIHTLVSQADPPRWDTSALKHELGAVLSQSHKVKLGFSAKAKTFIAYLSRTLSRRTNSLVPWFW